MNSFCHQNLIYQVNIEENGDSINLNTTKTEKQFAKTSQREIGFRNSIDSDSNSNNRESIQHPFIIKINNQQQNQNLGDQSNSLQRFPSLLQVSSQMSKKNIQEISKEEINISICQDSQQGGKTSDSFMNNQSDTIQKTEYNPNILYSLREPSINQLSNKGSPLKQSNMQNMRRQKSFSIQKLNNQPNQFDQKRKKKFSVFENQNAREKKEQYKIISGVDNKQKAYKKRNNLLLMGYQTQRNIWRTKWIQITSLVSKMKKIAHNSSLFFRPNELSDLQIRLINDISSNQVSLKFSSFSKYKLGSFLSFENLQNLISFKNYRKMVKFILKYFGWLIKINKVLRKIFRVNIIKILNLLPLFHNLSFFYILWELVICLSSSLLFIYIPFEFSFLLQRDQFFDFYFSYYCKIIFGMDIFIKFITKSSEQGTFTDQHLQVFSNYFKGSFFIDLISLLSLNNTFFGFQYTQFLFFLRIFSSFRILDIIKEQFLLKMKMFVNDFFMKTKGIISLVHLFVQVIYFGHLFTCLWNYIGFLQLEENKGWVVFYKFQNESVASKYVEIYYFTTVTMTTIGYGDFTAQTHLEKMIMIFFVFFSCGIFGYTINSIGKITTITKNQPIFKLTQKKDLYLQELAKVNKYFKQNNVELGLQCRARKYIQYLYSDESNDNISSIKSLSNLSEYLQREIQTDVYMKKLKKIKIFSEIFTDEILVELSLQMKEVFYCHDQKVSQTDEDNDQFLYFVNNGIILEYCQYESNTIVKEIKEYRQGQHFGLLAFLQGDNRRKVQYKSLGVSSILIISYSSFVNIIKEHNLAYQKFCFIRDEVKLSNKLMKISAYCYSCQQQNHVIEECPYLFYEGKKQVILRNYFRSQDKKFKNFRRAQITKSQNAIICQNRVSTQADKYYLSNIECFSMWDLTEGSGFESDEDFQKQSEINPSRQQIEKQKSNLESSYDRTVTPINHKIDSSIIVEQFREMPSQRSSDIQILLQEKEKNKNSLSNIATLFLLFSIILIQPFLMKQPERLSTDICQMPSEFSGKYVNLVKKMDMLFRTQSHNYNSCQIQNCNYCKKQSEIIYNLLEKNISFKKELTSKLSDIVKNFGQENRPRENTIFYPNKERNEIDLHQFHQQLSLNQNKLQKQNSFIDIRQKIHEIEKLLKKNSIKLSQENQQVDEQLFCYDFDQQTNFIYYYPLSNIENIIQQFNANNTNFILKHRKS